MSLIVSDESESEGLTSLVGVIVSSVRSPSYESPHIPGSNLSFGFAPNEGHGW